MDTNNKQQKYKILNTAEKKITADEKMREDHIHVSDKLYGKNVKFSHFHYPLFSDYKVRWKYTSVVVYYSGKNDKYKVVSLHFLPRVCELLFKKLWKTHSHYNYIRETESVINQKIMDGCSYSNIVQYIDSRNIDNITLVDMLKLSAKHDIIKKRCDSILTEEQKEFVYNLD